MWPLMWEEGGGIRKALKLEMPFPSSCLSSYYYDGDYYHDNCFLTQRRNFYPHHPPIWTGMGSPVGVTSLAHARNF